MGKYSGISAKPPKGCRLRRNELTGWVKEGKDDPKSGGTNEDFSEKTSTFGEKLTVLERFWGDRLEEEFSERGSKSDGFIPLKVLACIRRPKR